MRGVYSAAIAGTVLMLGVMPGASVAQDLKTTSFPASKLFPFLDSYLGLPPAARDHFRLRYRFHAETPVSRLVLKRPTENVPLRIGTNDELAPQPSLEDLKTAQVEMTAKTGTKYMIGLQVEESMAPALTLDAAALKTGIDQAHDGSRRIAGLMAALVPNFQSVCFLGAGSGSVIMADGQPKPLKLTSNPHDTQHLNPCFTPADYPGAKQVILAHMPSALPIVERPPS
ncbi:MAG: hypothetical protein ACXWKW_11595 [Asticcacaulis sp.]